MKTLKDRFPENCLETIIKTCTKLREAASDGKPIAEYDKRCAGFRDYQDLTQEILDQESAIKDKGMTLRSFLEVDERLKHPEERGIVFTLEAPESASVQIAGDFNNWKPQSLDFAESQGRPLWHKTISLRPGSYQYKYLVDGRWIADPSNDKTVDDRFGGTNSMINV